MIYAYCKFRLIPPYCLLCSFQGFQLRTFNIHFNKCYSLKWVYYIIYLDYLYTILSLI